MDYRIESKTLEDRIIFLDKRLDDDIANDIVMKLLYLENKDPHADISLYINSAGGSVSAGMAIYDTVKHIRCDVRTICIGTAASMAAFLLSSGTPGKRFALPNSEIMLHQPHSEAGGQISDIMIQAKHFQRIKNKMIDIIAYNCDQPISKVRRDMERDYFMSAEEARDYGVIDKII